jgi:hypothetical protein
MTWPGSVLEPIMNPGSELPIIQPGAEAPPTIHA